MESDFRRFLIFAAKLGLGIDIDRHYCEIAQKRLNEVQL